MPGIGIGINIRIGASLSLSEPSVELEAETTALISRFASEPDSERKILINDAIKSLKDEGLFSKLDVLCLVGAEEQGSLQNWVQNSYNATVVNSPTFLADRYFQGDAVSIYINTNFNPAEGIPKYKYNSASFGLILNSEGISSGDHGVIYFTPSFTTIQTLFQIGDDICLINSNGNYFATLPNTNSGIFAAVMETETLQKAYINGSDSNITFSGAFTSTDVPELDFRILGKISQNPILVDYNDDKISGWFLGESLSASEVGVITTIIETYLDGIGGGVIA